MGSRIPKEVITWRARVIEKSKQIRTEKTCIPNFPLSREVSEEAKMVRRSI
mgnify:CR=1 FL=1